MRLTDDRINFLSHHIIRTLARDKTIRVDDESGAVVEIKKSIIKFMQTEESVDQKARAKIQTLKRGVQEGSREWDILYEQYYSEELEKMKSF